MTYCCHLIMMHALGKKKIWHVERSCTPLSPYLIFYPSGPLPWLPGAHHLRNRVWNRGWKSPGMRQGMKQEMKACVTSQWLVHDVRLTTYYDVMTFFPLSQTSWRHVCLYPQLYLYFWNWRYDVTAAVIPASCMHSSRLVFSNFALYTLWTPFNEPRIT